MKINLKCFADLADKYECDYRSTTVVEAEEGSTVEGVMEQSGIERSDVRIVFVNGVVTNANRRLGQGDRVTLVPATGGM